jgi:hypothetical protein
MKIYSIMAIRLIIAALILLPIWSASVMAQESCEKLINTTPRGMMCLYCTHKTAPGGSKPITNLLKSTCLKNLAISFVVDGSFGQELDQIANSITELTLDGRQLSLELYLFNGPAQRRYRSNAFKSWATMNPARFREYIKTDPKTKRAFNRSMEELFPILDYAAEKNVALYLAPGLEDNLDNFTFRYMLAKMKKKFAAYKSISYIRSACIDCARGNESQLPKGTIREQHGFSLADIVRGGILATDGFYFHFSNENLNKPTLSDLSSVVKESSNRDTIFFLWVHHYQDTPPGPIPRPISQRKFRGPTESEAQEIIDFLRTR